MLTAPKQQFISAGSAPSATEDVTLLLIGGAGPGPLGVDSALCTIPQARSRGLRIHFSCEASTLAATVPACVLADTIDVVDVLDIEAILAWAARLPRDRRYIAFCNREYAQVAAAEVAAFLKIPGNRPDVMRTVRTKDLCRTALARAGMAQPFVALCSTHDDALSALRAGRGPWIVKPRDGAGSEGVSLVRDESELPTAMAALPDPPPFLVEEFVEGTEYSVEGLFHDRRPEILAITEKKKTPLPHFVEIGHALPAELPDSLERSIRNTVTKALEVLQMEYGAFHIELWATPNGIVMGEVHGRVGGGYIYRLVHEAAPGLALFGEVFDDALGISQHLERTVSRGAASRYFTPPPGRIVAIEGWEAVKEHPAVSFFELSVGPGDVVPPLRSSADRMGAIVVGAETTRAAKQLADHLVAQVRFFIEPLQ